MKAAAMAVVPIVWLLARGDEFKDTRRTHRIAELVRHSPVQLDPARIPDGLVFAVASCEPVSVQAVDFLTPLTPDQRFQWKLLARP